MTYEIKEFAVKLSKIFKDSKYTIMYNNFSVQGIGLITDGITEYIVIEINNGFFKSNDVDELKATFKITEKVEIEIDTLFGDI